MVVLQLDRYTLKLSVCGRADEKGDEQGASLPERFESLDAALFALLAPDFFGGLFRLSKIV